MDILGVIPSREGGRGMESEVNMAREVRFGSLGIFVEGERPS